MTFPKNARLISLGNGESRAEPKPKKPSGIAAPSARLVSRGSGEFTPSKDNSVKIDESPEGRADLLRALKSSETTIEGAPVSSLMPETKEKLETAAMSPESPKFLADALFGGEQKEAASISELFEQHKGTARQAFAVAAGQVPLLGFGDELVAIAETAKDLFTGDLPKGKNIFDALIDRYRAHRDIKRAEFRKLEQDHPIASLVGSVAGTPFIPLHAPARTLLRTLPLGQRVLMSGKFGAKLGAAFGLGHSEADILRGEFLPLMGDIAIHSTLGATLGTVAETIFGSLAKGGRLPFTGKLGKQAAVSQIAGGGVKKVSDKLFRQLPTESMSKASSSIIEAEKQGLIKLSDFGIKQPSVVKSRSALSNAWKRFLDFFYTPETIDFKLLQTQTSKTLVNLADQADDILARTDKQLVLSKAEISVEKIFGKGALDKIRTLIQNAKLSVESGSTAQALDDILFQIQSENFTKSTSLLRTLKEFQRILGPHAFKAKKVLTGSAADSLQGIYNNLDKFIKKTMKTFGKQEYTKYIELQNSSNKIALFADMVDSGLMAQRGAQAGAQGFSATTITDELQNITGAASQFSSLRFGTPGGTGRELGRLITTPLRISSEVIARGFKPTLTWVSSVLPSFADGKVGTSRDKELAQHYIIVNNRLTPLEKAKQVTTLNTSGEFNINNIPDSIRLKAKGGD